MRTLDFLAGMGFGAALVYIFDPVSGNRRRALGRDKLTALKSREYFADRTPAPAAESTTYLPMGEDFTIAERVTAELGKHVSYPDALKTRVKDGKVQIKGAVLAKEVENLLLGLSKIKGVTGIENHLDVHENAATIPGMQKN